MIICPSCGSIVKGDLCLGCPSCGARAVGPPLAKAEYQLPSYGRAMIAAASGTVMSLGFLGYVIVDLAQYKTFSLRFDTLVTAGEVAAWRSKWVALALAILVLWSGARLIRGIKKDRIRFAGLRVARLGFAAAIVVTLLIGTLIGVTVPERWRRHKWATEAAVYARGYTIHRALLEYRDLHGMLPGPDDLVAELSTLPDPDGSIAEALRDLDTNTYKPSAVLAAASTKSKSQPVRGSALLHAASLNQPLAPTVSFTNYEIRLPGEDKVLYTDDDVIVRDGIILRASELPTSASTSSSRPGAP